MTQDWVVYMIEASDGSLYTGITTDITRRFRAHLAGKSGARYFHRGRQPVRVVYTEGAGNRSAASKREAAIKKLPRSEKLQLISAAQMTPS
ncbi:MAG: putative endonuclease [Porticoccus sp.]|jgi:putative endonuclease|uniref:GIY-YIG nuclease family protein n=1 Tax=Porticoccus sp. TaxID=2024853 RepID=UPI0039E54BEA|tara:strand:+ start:342622 stop:342894 length:273 start_codon:yes stop_codon:yes gene_type:complete